MVAAALGAAGVLAGAAAVSGCEHRWFGSNGPVKAVPQGVPSPFFADRSVWNAPLRADAPVAPDSPALVSTLAREVASERARRVGPWMNTQGYGVALYKVPRSQPLTRVVLDRREPALAQALASVPLPSDVQTPKGYDRHVAVWQPSTNSMWEFWQLRREADGWHASWGGRMRGVTQNPGFYRTRRAGALRDGERRYWGATATSIPLVAGLITAADARAGAIDHALTIGIPGIARDRFVAPARRTDGRSGRRAAVPAGTRFRLPADLDIEALNLTAFGAAVAHAVQKHGMVVRDTSSVVTFYGESNASSRASYAKFLGGQYPSVALDGFPWDKLQVVSPR